MTNWHKYINLHNYKPMANNPENYLQVLPIELVETIGSYCEKQVYVLFREYGDYSEYRFVLLGIYSTLDKAVEALINSFEYETDDKGQRKISHHECDIYFIQKCDINVGLNFKTDKYDYYVNQNPDTFNLYNMPEYCKMLRLITDDVDHNKYFLTFTFEGNTYVSYFIPDIEYHRIHDALDEGPAYKHKHLSNRMRLYEFY